MGWKPMPRPRQSPKMRLATTNHFRPREPNLQTYPKSNNRVMGFQPMSYAPNSSPTTSSIHFAEISRREGSPDQRTGYQFSIQALRSLCERVQSQ